MAAVNIYRHDNDKHNNGENTSTLRRMKAVTMDTSDDGSLTPAFSSAFLTTCSKTKMPPVPTSI